MGLHKDNLLGQTFHYLTVIGETDIRVGTNYKRKCRCICGNIKNIPGDKLKKKNKPIKSCGCKSPNRYVPNK